MTAPPHHGVRQKPSNPAERMTRWEETRWNQLGREEWSERNVFLPFPLSFLAKLRLSSSQRTLLSIKLILQRRKTFREGKAYLNKSFCSKGESSRICKSSGPCWEVALPLAARPHKVFGHLFNSLAQNPLTNLGYIHGTRELMMAKF